MYKNTKFLLQLVKGILGFLPYCGEMVFHLWLAAEPIAAESVVEPNQSSQLSSQQAIDQASSWASNQATKLSSKLLSQLSIQQSS